MMRPSDHLDVVIDGQSLIDTSRHRGLGTYVRSLARALADEPGLSVSVLGPGQDEAPTGVRAIPSANRLPLRLVPSNALRLALDAAEHRARTTRVVRRLAADVFHSTGLGVPGSLPLPFVQTIHDLTPFVFTHELFARDRRRWLRLAPRVRAASAVVVPSRSSADQVAALLDVPAERIHVIAHGVEPDLAAGRPGEPAAEPPYLLVVSAWGPHKGFREASAVIGRLAGLGYPHRLRIAGRLDGWLGARARAEVEAGGGAHRTEFVGFAADLRALYRGAAALISTSRAEGFGLPVVEAMASATPVVAFANTSLPEVVGEGGTLVADGDVEAMVAALRPLLDAGDARAEASGRALAWSRRFSWAAAAAAHREVYAAVSG